jgi:hypothetical protein
MVYTICIGVKLYRDLRDISICHREFHNVRQEGLANVKNDLLLLFLHILPHPRIGVKLYRDPRDISCISYMYIRIIAPSNMLHKILKNTLEYERFRVMVTCVTYRVHTICIGGRADWAYRCMWCAIQSCGICNMEYVWLYVQYSLVVSVTWNMYDCMCNTVLLYL